uniref:Syntaxin-52-like n=1 Tax=Populus alba TaxID=43335 RepID=A0A4U5QI43_POPAL|nr:syntaxin-52-like [Populus alba]
MATPSGSWMQEFNEASKLGDEINGMINGKNSLPPSGPETQRHLSATRRKIAILRTKLDILQSLLTALPSKQPITGKEMNRLQDMLKNLSTKVNQMATALNMSSAANRENLLGLDKKTDDDVVNRASGLDNHGLVGFQQQIMKEQDEGLEKLEETVTSAKHIALAVNEELTLHTKLLDGLDEHVDVTNSRLQTVQRKLALLNKRTKGGCSCLVLPVIAIVILIVIHFSILNKSSVPSRFLAKGEMASPSESWMQEFNEASKLGDEISAMISGKNSLPQSGPETQRQFSAARRKATILRTKLDILQSLLSALPSKQPLSGKEMNRRQEMLKNLSTKVNQMAGALNMFSAANRENLLGPDSKTDDVINRASSFDNQGLVGFQRQIMREQDEGLEKLEETVVSTKHIALAVNEELTLHTRLLDDLDEHVDVTNSRLQRVQKNLAILNKRTKGIGIAPSPPGRAWFLLADKMGSGLLCHIPSAIFNISSLQLLYLDANKLSGGLPTDICNHLPLLEELVLQGNQLSGQIPPCLCKCRQLRSLSMLGNNFDGNLTRDIGNLSMFTEMLFGRQHVRGIAATLKWESLQLSTYFYVNDCKLNGNIPSETGNLSNLIGLALTKHNFAGSIPSTMEGLRNIQLLDLSRNKLNGSILPFLCLARSLASSRRKSVEGIDT